MLYVAVFFIIILVILVVYLIRLYRNRLQRHQAKRDPSVLPSQIQDLNQNRPTLRSVAIDVTSHLNPPPRGGEHEAGAGRGGNVNGIGAYANYHARGVGGVTRVHGGESTTSLPAYGAESLPVPPNATYNPNRSRAGVQESVIPLYADDAPPKYTASTTTQPGVTV
ncbi:hypothetical protein IAT40_003194 [Kwoniella sp. CBS 6097]